MLSNTPAPGNNLFFPNPREWGRTTRRWPLPRYGLSVPFNVLKTDRTVGTQGGKDWGAHFRSRLLAPGAQIRPEQQSQTLLPPQGPRGSKWLGEVIDDEGAADGLGFWRPGPRRPARRRRPVQGAWRRPGRCPRARRLIGRCGSGWGRRGLGLALREAAAPPPRPRRGTIWSRQQRCPPAGMSLLR